MANQEQIRQSIEKEKIIVIVRRVYGERLIRLAQALYDGGIRLMEVTFDQGDADGKKKTGEAIAQLSQCFGERMYFGAGTVLDTEQAAAAKAAGARFIISPNINREVIRFTKEQGLVSIPGAMTPSEILKAHEAGADFVKIFPAIDLGLRYVKNIRGPINHVKLLATAGVNEENFADFLKAGYIGAGISGRLIERAVLDAGNYGELTKRAEVFCRIAREA